MNKSAKENKMLRDQNQLMLLELKVRVSICIGNFEVEHVGNIGLVLLESKPWAGLEVSEELLQLLTEE